MTKKQTYHLITLGCPKNEVDSDGMEMLLQQADIRASADARNADVLIVNTCGFLEAAKEESIGVLQELADAKQQRQMLIAAGCLAQRNGDEVLRRVPQVDGLLGTRRWMDVVELIGRVRNGPQQRRLQQYSLLGEPDKTYLEPVPRPPVTGGSAYLKISDGCNAPCAFCTIPSFKGKLRSRPSAALIDEANALVAAGAKELVLVAQDTTDFGRDRGEPDSLAQLLSALCNRTGDGLKWVRLMYAYPGHVSDSLIEVMASQDKIVPYLDMPLQHGDPRTLRRMRRPSRLEMIYDHVEKLRAVMPGYRPSDDLHRRLPGRDRRGVPGSVGVRAGHRIRQGRRVSIQPGTGHPRGGVARPCARGRERGTLQSADGKPSNRSACAKIRSRSAKCSTSWSKGKVKSPSSGDPLVLGRSYRDAPEVDGLVLVPGVADAPAGAMLQVHINGALEYDLVGEPLIAETYSSRTDLLANFE